MSDQPPRWQPKRVLASLLANADGRAALAQAGQLAQLLGAELACVFVEEADLFTAAALPSSTEIGRISRRPRPFDSSTLATETERELASIRRDFAALTAMLGRPGDQAVEVLRGRAFDAIRRALPSDLVFYAGSSRRLAEPDLSDALLDAALHTAGILLPNPRPAPPLGPVVAVFGSWSGAERVLPVLQRLAGGPRGAIELFLPGAVPERDTAAHTLPNLRLRRLEEPAALRTAEAIATRSGARLLVGEASAELLQHSGDLRAVLRRLRCPLLLMNLAHDLRSRWP